MLTTDLLKFRRQNGQIKLQFIPLDSPNGLEICSAILALYNDAYKNTLKRMGYNTAEEFNKRLEEIYKQ
jgi:predicted nuclease of restriction endonuclease-like RecB superfamily